MFGSSNPFGQSSSSPFGQSSSSPFGQSSIFGQTSSATTNPFSPSPFGTPSNTFGSPAGGSIFGGTSTGVFGQPSSPLSSPAFGASSTPAFGASSTPAFGVSSTPAFGASSSAFGGSSLFGAKPTFGGFGSTPQQSQPAFGGGLFGSTSTFGASQPAFGSTSTPAFGSTTTPSFGATPALSFGATSTPAFGASTTPAFGSTGTSLFGSTGSAFGASSTPAFGATSSSIFGSSSTPAFGAASTPSFGFSATPAFGQTSSAFGATSPFGQTASAFGQAASSSPFGAQTTTPTFGSPGFGQPAFGAQQVGSRVASYVSTPEADGGTGGQATGKLESISAMPTYKEKSHEELRWEDYQRGDKGGPSTAGQASSGFSFPSATTSSFGTPSAFGQTSAFASTAASPFGQKPPAFGSTGFGASSASSFSSPFGVSSSSPFGAPAASSGPSLFGASTPAFGVASTPAFGAASTPMFGASSTPAFGASSFPAFGASSTPAFGASSTPAFGASSSSIFGGSVTSAFGGASPFGASSAAGLTTPAFGASASPFGGTQASGLFMSSPSFGQTPSPFGQASSGFGATSSTFGSSIFGGTPSTGFGGGLFSGSTPSLVPSSTPMGFSQPTTSFSSPFQISTPAQTSGALSFAGFGQTQPGGFGSGMFAPTAATQPGVVIQPAPITSPFGTLPSVPQMSIGRTGSAPSVQYGISSMPVAEKPAPMRISSLLTPRHLTQRRIKLPPRKYHPKTDGPLVPFFREDEEASSAPKADAFFIPRENPRALMIQPIEKWPPRLAVAEESPASNGETGRAPREKGKTVAEPSAPARNGSSSSSEEHPGGAASAAESGRAAEAAMSVVPRLRNPEEYYTEPSLEELAAKERAHPGFCGRVRDFVIGRREFGSIRFEGETDVRGLDLEAIVQFNRREVIVYGDDDAAGKPEVGKGLNRPAEVTLLNVRCSNRKTGKVYTDGPNVQRYEDMLRTKVHEQGAHFVSFNPAKGEWKFRVDHFSRYFLPEP